MMNCPELWNLVLKEPIETRRDGLLANVGDFEG